MMYDEDLEDLDEAKPNKCRTCCCFLWKTLTCIFSHILLVSLVVSYCILGAFTFERLERDNEVLVKKSIPNIRNKILNEIWDFTSKAEVLHDTNWTHNVTMSLKHFENELIHAVKKKGWDGTEDESATQWTFAGALFYSIIVITTIGYGHIAPKTQWGKVVTIFYAILGIPLMLLCLSNIGDIMAHSFRFIYWRICCYVCTKKPKRPPSRRGRSVRGSVRQPPGSARASGRSRSFKYPGRTSQRSADSGLGMSETAARSSYSDTECNRYNDDNDLNIGGQFRESQRSRYSDTAVPSNTGDIVTPSNSVKYKGEPADGPDEPPVLFNKYALERDESMKAAQRPAKFRSSSTLPRQGPIQQYHPSPQYQSSPYAGSLKRQTEIDRSDLYAPDDTLYPEPQRGRPRVMSPMGFAVPRQQNYKPTRLSRLREDMDYEYDEYETNSGSQSTAKIKPVPIWLCVFLVVSYIFSGAFLFAEWEGWTFLDAAYFCFITLTTIGFGDFVPAQRVNINNDAEISIALCSLYLLFGIALLAMSFNLVQEEVINNVKSVAKSLGIIKNDEEDED